MSSESSLGERQAAAVREVILDALASRLDRDGPGEIAMPQVAADAGISLRTLYRYFPTREAMFDAVGDHVVARLGLPRQIEGADDIARVFLESARRAARALSSSTRRYGPGWAAGPGPRTGGAGWSPSPRRSPN